MMRVDFIKSGCGR